MSRGTDLGEIVSRLAVATTTGVLPPDLGSQLLDGFQRFQAGGPGADLAVALGVRRSSREQVKARNLHIRAAAAELVKNPHQTTAYVAERLAEKMARFDECHGRLLLFTKVDPVSLGCPVLAHLYRAKCAASWGPLPTSERQIRRILDAE